MGVTLTQDMINGAIATQNKYGVPASITLGQIMLESGGSYEGGLSGLAYKFKNLFGMTAGSSWKGETVYMTNKNGTDGQNYRVYSTFADSIEDHGKLLSSERYTKYTSSAKTISEYASALSQAGYATDSQYASKLMNVINSNNLTQYDNGSYSNSGGTSNVVLTSSEGDNELKWWGDIVVIVLCILLIAIGVVFFVLAFNGGSVKNVGMSIANKATGGLAKKVSKVGK